MTNLDLLRNEIIQRVLSISDKSALQAINHLANHEQDDKSIKLSREQKLMLDLSDEDIKQHRTIRHTDMIREKQAWLKGK